MKKALESEAALVLAAIERATGGMVSPAARQASAKSN